MDQEVVREPFDDDECVRSDGEEQHGDPSSVERKNHILSKTDGDGRGDEETTSRTGRGITRKYEYDNDSDEGVGDAANSFDEDAKFAQSFGIRLKDKRPRKIDSAYEKLFNSEHIKTETKDSKTNSIQTSITSDCIYHKGTFYQKGDIVALCDQDDGQVYFAQLTGFLQDRYCEKSASVNWLVPTKATSRELFDPTAYRIGLEDVQLRKLDCMTFVRHCPHDYYLRKLYRSEHETDQSTRQESNQIGLDSKSTRNQSFIWTSLETCQVPLIKTNR